MSYNNNNGYAANSYGSSATSGYGSYSGGSGNANGVGSTSSGDGNTGLRHRNTHLNGSDGYTNHHYSGDYYDGNYDSKGKKSSTVEKLDFMFPKVAEEFTVKTHGGGVATVASYVLILILVVTEIFNWMGQNRLETSTAVVDTSLGKQMRVNMNITFPALACEDLHLDAIDVAGDSQINIEDTLKKKKLHKNGNAFSQEEIDVELNKHREEQVRKLEILKSELPEGYCGPCYGAHETEGQCCNTCDEVIEAYKKKSWKNDLLQYTAEQCVREGRDKMEPKKILKRQGCNLSGYMTVNRVAGNFHIAMGEGIERDGRHIHTYNPEDAINFNASHIIHQLSFGPEGGNEPLNGMTKIVTESAGSTGLFQYFIKIVPTTYVGEGTTFPNFDMNLPSLFEATEEAEANKKDTKRKIETNRYFFTERFRPLMTDLLEDEDYEDDDHGKAAADTGYTGGHHNKAHHAKQNSVLPGVFFIYEIYPFAMEIKQNEVPFTHLLIRLMATIGGVFTLARWVDSFLNERVLRKNRPGGNSGNDRRPSTRFSVNT
eukprot:CAMPEP_0172384706 /NCGR_PEP_ID=MMETSP1061-20121228/2444_1 /TAXON_ID=37318 /ORGANISM="Pseudo-nitzschia pungens, Strain cf. pungens" /LENGTH=542 /DNA_ID=CAMNT_0013113445 /DNA_START=97 /DNA_END=1725 /DNA_ORIENTATION=-